MSLLTNIRLGLLHVAVAMTLVPINGVLNRVMIHDLEILSSLVAALVITPYLLSPIQIWIGQYSDHNPLFGYRRTPYIAGGLLLCISGAVVTPHAALLIAHDFWLGLGLGALAFGSWGMGFNIAVVAYLSLASDLTDEKRRSRTIATMWFMMICSVIITAIVVGRALDPYSDTRLLNVFAAVGASALLLACIGLIGLEPRYAQPLHADEQRVGQLVALQAVTSNPQARLFFCYLILLLAAILGQDLLLEPFGAWAFGMTVTQTTRLTALWGGATLVTLLLEGMLLSRYLSKRTNAVLGAVLATGGLLLIASSGIIGVQPLFFSGIVLLGAGTGIATATNLALMLDMTTPEQAGLFIGAWGVADALARGIGTLLSGVVRDLVSRRFDDIGAGYVSVFLIQAAMLVISLLLLRKINIAAFRERQPVSITDLAARSDS